MTDYSRFEKVTEKNLRQNFENRIENLRTNLYNPNLNHKESKAILLEDTLSEQHRLQLCQDDFDD